MFKACRVAEWRESLDDGFELTLEPLSGAGKSEDICIRRCMFCFRVLDSPIIGDDRLKSSAGVAWLPPVQARSSIAVCGGFLSGVSMCSAINCRGELEGRLVYCDVILSSCGTAPLFFPRVV